MRFRRYSIALYVVFVMLLVAQSIWWVVYLGREGENFGRYYLQRLRTDQLHAAYLVETLPSVAEDPELNLGEVFPALIFNKDETGVEVTINPESMAAIAVEVRRRQRMFLWEGSFFLLVLLGGLALVTTAFVRETRFKRARELFLTGVTHEFKTPLASLQLYTETLSRSDLDSDKREGILLRMQDDLERLGAMVEQVLAVSRLGVAHATTRDLINLGEEAKQALSGFQPLLNGTGAKLQYVVSSGCWMMGDREALRMVVRNLIDNALRHCPPGVNIQLSVIREGSRVVLAVKDDGPGIPVAEREKIFRSFYRVGEVAHRRSGARGTGLGLHLVRRNVEHMGGRVRLESTPGEGACFCLSFPAAESRESTSSKGGGESR